MGLDISIVKVPRKGIKGAVCYETIAEYVKEHLLEDKALVAEAEKQEERFSKGFEVENGKVKSVNLYILADIMSGIMAKDPDYKPLVIMGDFRKCNFMLGHFNSDIEEDSNKWKCIGENQIRDLIEKCDIEIANADNPEFEHVLPTIDGFFFGNTDYNATCRDGEGNEVNIYQYDIKLVKRVCERLLERKLADEDWEYYMEFDW